MAASKNLSANTRTSATQQAQMAMSEPIHNDDDDGEQIISERDFAEWVELQGVMSTENDFDVGATDIGDGEIYDSIVRQDHCQKNPETLPPSRGRKRSRELNRPARPLSAYNLFFKATHNELIQERGSSVSFAAMGKLVGKKWRELSKQERKVWEEKADFQSDQYHAALQRHRSLMKEEAGRESLLTAVQRASASKTSSTQDRSSYTFTAHNVPVHDQPSQSNTSSADDLLPPSQTLAGSEQLDAALSLFGAIELTQQLPKGFEFPQGLPQSGVSVPFRFPDGSTRESAIEWKVYAVRRSQANAFMEKVGKEMSLLPVPLINEHAKR